MFRHVKRVRRCCLAFTPDITLHFPGLQSQPEFRSAQKLDPGVQARNFVYRGEVYPKSISSSIIGQNSFVSKARTWEPSRDRRTNRWILEVWPLAKCKHLLFLPPPCLVSNNTPQEPLPNANAANAEHVTRTEAR